MVATAQAIAVCKRPQSLGEEIANSVSHGAGLLAVLVGAPFLVIAAVPHGLAELIGASIFSVTLAILYLTSTLYHALPRSRAKQVMRILDHAAIFLLIAGTYTPFTLGVLRGGWGWTLFGLVWGIGLAGIALKIVRGPQHPRLSLTLYLGAGWLVLIAVRPLWVSVPPWGLFWLLAGGVAYTAGVVFYVTDRVRYRHFIWHLCVLAGTGCHFVAVLRYAS